MLGNTGLRKCVSVYERIETVLNLLGEWKG